MICAHWATPLLCRNLKVAYQLAFFNSLGVALTSWNLWSSGVDGFIKTFIGKKSAWRFTRPGTIRA